MGDLFCHTRFSFSSLKCKPTKQPLLLDLIKRCKANDRKAQMQLYDTYVQGMYGVAMRFLANEADAEDVVQESFIKAFQRMDQYQGRVTFGAWLKKIVVNGCLDFLKSKRMPIEPYEEQFLEINNIDADIASEGEVSLDEIKSAINHLDHPSRFVVQLYLIEGYDHQEIAHILGISEANSRTRLKRGKEKLRSALKHKVYGKRA